MSSLHAACRIEEPNGCSARDRSSSTGLLEIADDPIPQGTVPDSLIWVRGDEDRRDPMSGINQMSVELDPCHSGHLNVGDQASGLRQRGDARKLAGDGNASTV